MGYTADLDNPQKRTPLSCLRNRNAIPWMSSSQSTLCTDYAINAEIPHSCLVGLLDPVRGGTILLRNFGNYLPVATAQDPRRHEPAAIPLSEPKTSQRNTNSVVCLFARYHQSPSFWRLDRFVPKTLVIFFSEFHK